MSRKIILRQTQSPGDILTFTRLLADINETYPDWKIDVRTPCSEIFIANPRITSLKDDEEGVETFNITYDGINDCGWKQEHWTDAYREDAEKKLGVHIQKHGILPELYLSDEEKGWYNQIHCEFKDDSPFWIINAGRKQDNELKAYHRWQEVVDLFNEYFKNKVKLVQVGHHAHIHPELKGVYNLVGKTDLRQLIRLGYHASGFVGPLSFQFVMAAAFKKPGVVVAGGKEDVRWHLYPHIRHLYTNGALKCCSWGGCWKGGEIGQCVDLVDGTPRCFNLIEPYMIVDAIISYYKGGMLTI